jgi:methionyl-tRNA formyltransferase
MRIIYFANNLTGLRVLEWLVARREEIVAVVVHPSEKAKHRAEIVKTSGLAVERVFEGQSLTDSAVVARIKALRPDIGVSIFFGYILPRDLLSVFPKGCINVHPAYLPYNRGAYSNVWAIVERTPAGATLHYVDPGIDSGDVISRRQIDVLPTDTGKSLYARLAQTCIDLFRESWPSVRSGSAPRAPQDHQQATSHKVRDVERIDRIDLDRAYKGQELIDILRARTFPPHRGAYMDTPGGRVYLRLQLLTEDQIDRPEEDHYV